LDQYNFVIKELPYLGLYNAQILYFVGGVCIINRNNVFHSFPDREITCPPIKPNTLIKYYWTSPLKRGHPS
jgi:hypothetical protein